MQYTRPPEQYTRAPMQYTRPPEQYTRAPMQHTRPPEQYTRAPVQYTRPPEQYTPAPMQHTRPPEQHTRAPMQHTRPPMQHTRPPVQHTRPPQTANSIHGGLCNVRRCLCSTHMLLHTHCSVREWPFTVPTCIIPLPQLISHTGKHDCGKARPPHESSTLLPNPPSHTHVIHTSEHSRCPGSSRTRKRGQLVAIWCLSRRQLSRAGAARAAKEATEKAHRTDARVGAGGPAENTHMKMAREKLCTMCVCARAGSQALFRAIAPRHWPHPFNPCAIDPSNHVRL
eukprot:354158-Chlamydomonas_euryale.AAC.2